MSLPFAGAVISTFFAPACTEGIMLSTRKTDQLANNCQHADCAAAYFRRMIFNSTEQNIAAAEDALDDVKADSHMHRTQLQLPFMPTATAASGGNS